MHKIITTNRFLFSLFGTKINEGLIRSSNYSPINHDGRTVEPQPPRYQVSKLNNGIRVLTQSVSVPSTVHLGLFVDVGTRDETAQTSGAMLSLKNTYLKTAINTSETVNYGIMQMSGGEFEMEYNRENSYYRASCLAHDVVDVFSMVADSAFEPKNFVSTSVGMYKNQKSHKLETFLGGNTIFEDSLFQAAFGRSSLGMPLHGFRSNVSSLTAYVIQKFQAEQITPDRIVISAAGVEDHQEFVDVVSEKLASSILPEKKAERQAAKYLGGEVRNLTEANNIHVLLAFEGARHENTVPFLVAQQILGNNRKLGRIQKNILNKHVYIDAAQSVNANYADTGLFGLKISGSASHAEDILEVAINELNGLRNVSGAEVELAKKSLRGRINRDFDSNWRRLEDRTKSLYYLGRSNEDLTSQVESVTEDQVKAAVEAAIKTRLTLVAQGGEVNALPSWDKVSSRFL